jgi:AmmeMemoRadiSam system protein B/uncharacterized protein (TIGR00296 family)
MKCSSYFIALLTLSLVTNHMDRSISRADVPLETRLPRFAGTWYEDNGDSLDKQLSGFLSGAKAQMKLQAIETAFPNNTPVNDNILAIVVPHAGYSYSGQTAAFAYEKLSAKRFGRVFLLGPSHRVAFTGGALPKESVFATPLGDLPIDREQIRELSYFNCFREMAEVHDQEHSLEMQLPFIRKTLGNIKIVPIAIGALSNEGDIRLIGSILKRYIHKNDLVIISSDFTHYGPRFSYEPFHTDVEKQIKKLDEEAFQQLQPGNLKGFLQFHDRTNDTICGLFPCSILLSILPAKAHATLLRYRTSQDVIFDPDHNSVSYMSIVYSCNDKNTSWGDDKDSKAKKTRLSASDGQALLKIARLSLISHLDQKQANFEEILTKDQRERFNDPRGVFVTLFKKGSQKSPSQRKDGKQLRGCIGYIWPIKSTLESAAENAISASTKDPRFQPVQISELADIQIEISVLTPPLPVSSWRDIKLGTDGIILYKDGKQAVFLPSVAPEFGWDLPQTLTQLSLKAGLAPDAWKENTLFDVFQAQSFEE